MQLYIRPSVVVMFSAGFLLSVGANLLLLQHTRELMEDYRDYRIRVESRPLPDTTLPPLRGRDRDGNDLTVSYTDDGKYTLLLIYSPLCPYCADNWPQWLELIAGAKRNGVRIVAVDTLGTSDDKFLQSYNLESTPVFVEVDYATRAAYNIQLTPTTMVIRPDGTLEASWIGVLTPSTMSELRLFLDSPTRTTLTSQSGAANP